jgi:hypothetical protein
MLTKVNELNKNVVMLLCVWDYRDYIDRYYANCYE